MPNATRLWIAELTQDPKRDCSGIFLFFVFFYETLVYNSPTICAHPPLDFFHKQFSAAALILLFIYHFLAPYLHQREKCLSYSKQDGVIVEDCATSNYFICNGYINYVECVNNSFESDAHKQWKYSSQTKFCYMVNRSGIASVKTGGFFPHSGRKLEKYKGKAPYVLICQKPIFWDPLFLKYFCQKLHFKLFKKYKKLRSI